MRLFFDVRDEQSNSYDFHGRDFNRQEDAAQMAHLIALDLGSSETTDWSGSEIQVRDAAGETLFLVPILPSGVV